MLTWVVVGFLGQAASLQPVEGGLGQREEEQKVYVTIESDASDVRLIRHGGSTMGTVSSGGGSSTIVLNTFREECAAPCEKYVLKPQDRFYVTGSGIFPSDQFSLLGKGNSLHLKVHGGSAFLRVLGVFMLAIGPTVATLGGTYVLIDWLLNLGKANVPDPYSSIGGISNTMRTIAWGSFLGGAAATITGIPLIAFTGTRVEILPGILPSKSTESLPGEL